MYQQRLNHSWLARLMVYIHWHSHNSLVWLSPSLLVLQLLLVSLSSFYTELDVRVSCIKQQLFAYICICYLWLSVGYISIMPKMLLISFHCCSTVKPVASFKYVGIYFIIFPNCRLFAAQYYASVQPMPLCGVCLSVTFVYCVKTSTVYSYLKKILLF